MPEALARVARSLGHRPWFARVGRLLVPLDRAFLSRSGARRTALSSFGLPQLLLTTTGRRTGMPRTVPLLYVPDGADYVVVASNWGQAHHPAWSSNLLADPAATVEVDGFRRPVRATLVEGEERAELWGRVTRMWPAYDTYEARSGRDIRLFRLRATRG